MIMASNFFAHGKRRNKIVNLIPKDEDKLDYVPEIISIKNMSIYDMEKIHGFALKFFSNEEKRIPELTRDLDYKKELLGPHQNLVERLETLEEISKIEKEILEIESSTKKENYLAEILPLIEIFKDISNSMEKIEFGEEENDDSDDITKYMLLIIDTIKKYTKITFDIELSSKFCCAECDFDLTNVIPEQDGIIRCPECRVENEANRCPKKFVSITKNISTSHGDYSDRENFHKFINRFQGKHNPTIDQIVYDKLDQYFIKEKEDIGDVVKQRPYDHKNFKQGTNLDMMLKALSCCGFSEHYDNAYYIGQEYWGWILADFKNDEDEIMYIYDITQVAYIKIENKTRTSSISIPFRGFKITELLGYPYEMSDFKIPKDEKSREERDKYWKISCETCGDPDVVYIPTRKY